MLIRIITGLILGVLSIVLVFFAPIDLFAAVLGVLVSMAAVEWLNLVGYRAWPVRISYIVVLWLLTWATWHMPLLVLCVGTGAWFFAVIAVLMARSRDVFTILKTPVVQLPLGAVMLIAAWVGAMQLMHIHRVYMFYAIWVIGMGDSGAYFVGSKWGKIRIAPTISPKKSVEGLMGQLVIGCLSGMALLVFMPPVHAGDYPGWLLLTVLMILLGVFGDLFESLVKRMNEVKDSGNLLPGHGGVLDRLDALLAVLPFYALCLSYFLMR